MLADFDPAVTAMAAQPFRLIGLDGSRVRRHVPGVLLADADGGVTVVDVKAPGQALDPKPKLRDPMVADTGVELGKR